MTTQRFHHRPPTRVDSRIGAADLQFTIASVYDAPTDGSAMKLVTLVQNTRSSEPHASTSSPAASDVDRQMTYYTDSGEFHFEFGLDRCGANFPTQK